MSTMSFVAADLGASGIRCTTENGKINTLPNNMVHIPDGEITELEPNSEDIESNLEFTITKKEQSDIFPVTCLYGKMAERRSSNQIRPSVMQHKHKQVINYISSILTVAVEKLKFNLADDIIYVLDVPPVELSPARKAFKEKLVGSYTVTFPKYMGGTTVSFNIIDVEAYPESVMAVASFFFNMSGVIKEEHKPFMSGQVLSLDIGASTSDLAIIKDGKFLDMTGRTYKTGGNIARAELINSVRSEYGYDLPIPDAERTIAEGRLQQGNGFVDVGYMVTDAKQKLARSLVESMMTYFSEVNIPIHTIRGIVVSGGGSMAGKYINDEGEEVKTSEPLSYFVTEELKNICNTVDVLPYGEDARFANIKGLFIRAKLLMAKKSAAIAQAQAVQAQSVSQPVVQNVQPVQTTATPVQPVQNVQAATPVAQTVTTPVTPVVQNTPPSVPQI